MWQTFEATSRSRIRRLRVPEAGEFVERIDGLGKARLVVRAGVLLSDPGRRRNAIQVTRKQSSKTMDSAIASWFYRLDVEQWCCPTLHILHMYIYIIIIFLISFNGE